MLEYLCNIPVGNFPPSYRGPKVFVPSKPRDALLFTKKEFSEVEFVLHIVCECLHLFIYIYIYLFIYICLYLYLYLYLFIIMYLYNTLHRVTLCARAPCNSCYIMPLMTLLHHATHVTSCHSCYTISPLLRHAVHTSFTTYIDTFISSCAVH